MMEKLIFDVKNSFCLLNRFANCQGRQKLSDNINTYLDSVNTVQFEQWESTNRNMLHHKKIIHRVFCEPLSRKKFEI